MTDFLFNLRWRVSAWWMWWSPPWSRYRVCPGCAGSKRIMNSYDVRDCGCCGGTGKVHK